MKFFNIFSKTKRFFSNIDFLKNTEVFRGEDGDDDDGDPPPPPPPCPPMPPGPPMPPCPPCPSMGGSMSEVYSVGRDDLKELLEEGVELELPVINLDDLPEDQDFYLVAPESGGGGIMLCPAPPACVRTAVSGMSADCKWSANVDVPVDMPGNSKICVEAFTNY